MEDIDLTPEEILLIQETRRQAAARAEKLRLCYACIDVLQEWKDWSHANGRGLTFSTFVDEFLGGDSQWEGCDSKLLFEGVKVMITALDELHG